jgi:hypothetical protein
MQETPMIEGKLSECTRCGNERKTMTIFIVRPGGHTFSTLTQPDFELDVPPTVERSCGECLTDDEITRELSPAVEFVLGTLVKNASPNFPDILVSLETARSFFMVRNNNPDGSNRRAAVRALGLTED